MLLLQHLLTCERHINSHVRNISHNDTQTRCRSLYPLRVNGSVWLITEDFCESAGCSFIPSTSLFYITSVRPNAASL